MCKVKITIFGVSVLISLLTSLTYAQIQQITVTSRATPCPDEAVAGRNNTFAETPTTISADGTLITFLSNCNITGGNPDQNTELMLWVQGPPARFIQVTNTTTNGTKVVTQNNPAITVAPVAGQPTARIAFMSNALTSPGPNCAPGSEICPCPNCPGNADGNSEIFRADVTLSTSALNFTQATNTNRTGTSCVDCPLTDIKRTTATGWPVINLDGTAIAFHSCCPISELSPCSSVLNPSCTNTVSNNDVYQWRDGAPIPYTQVTRTAANTNNFAISMTTVAGSSRVAFYGNGDVIGQNPDLNNEIFLWTEGAPTPIRQITQTTNCSNRLPSINAGGFLISFSSTCPTGAGALTPCQRYDGAACNNTDGNEEIFMWENVATPFTQITQTPNSGRPAPDNFRSSISIVPTSNAAKIAFWSSLATPAPPGKAGDCRTAFDGTMCNNPFSNYQLFTWTEGAVPPFLQTTPNQRPPNPNDPTCVGANPPCCKPPDSANPPTCISLNSNDAGRLAFSYNCNPLPPNNNDGNYEIFIDPPRRR